MRGKDKSSSVTTYVVVGFRIDGERSVFYRQCFSEEELTKAVLEAFNNKKAQFLSIRKIVGGGRV